MENHDEKWLMITTLNNGLCAGDLVRKMRFTQNGVQWTQDWLLCLHEPHLLSYLQLCDYCSDLIPMLTIVTSEDLLKNVDHESDENTTAWLENTIESAMSVLSCLLNSGEISKNKRCNAMQHQATCFRQKRTAHPRRLHAEVQENLKNGTVLKAGQPGLQLTLWRPSSQLPPVAKDHSLIRSPPEWWSESFALSNLRDRLFRWASSTGRCREAKSCTDNACQTAL
jgi:hypothetical protein